ncbi:MAG: aminotransferase class V-fold PLP-dependent enzyme, partial [Actinomycetota bacterium]|nr:aminotransferase class V-fold PLP-dependent enzyme [Actinomycetota bacterium]
MHYLDHAATTPMLDEVVDAMSSLYRREFGNPSSVHAYGREARRAVEDARDKVSGAVGASPSEIVFTGGGTEADNLAIKGTASKLQASGRHIVVSGFEHHAVLDPALYLRKQGFDVTVLPVPASGVLAADAVAEAVRNDTILVSIMAVNNEIGT